MSTQLPPALRTRVESLIECAEDQSGRIVEALPVSGGCISQAFAIRMDDGRRYFLKSNASPLPRMFECEAEGLAALATAIAAANSSVDPAASLRIPRPLGAAEPKSPSDPGGPVPGFIVMEHIELGRPARDFMPRLARGLAALHRAPVPAAAHAPGHFGFAHDNYIGATPQPNPTAADWPAFFRDHRLGHQLALARTRGLADVTMLRLGDALLARLDQLLAEPAEPPCLIHGDLWGGNYLADASGAPVLIDPAPYYGRREADLAMTYLFGGFDASFYAAYNEAWPLAPNSAERIEVYKLYHLLNHLNLFGPGYYPACLAILQRHQ